MHVNITSVYFDVLAGNKTFLMQTVTFFSSLWTQLFIKFQKDFMHHFPSQFLPVHCIHESQPTVLICSETAINTVQTLPDLRNFKLHKVPGLHNFRERKSENYKTNILKRASICFLMIMQEQWDEGAGRILLGDNTGSRAVMLWPIRFQHAGFYMDSLAYTCIFCRMYTPLWLAQSLTCVRPSRS